MRLKVLSFIFLFAVSQLGFATTPNLHARPGGKAAATEATAPNFYPCSIEIINDSYSNVTVYGRYDDGVMLIPFSVYSYEYSHYIDLFYDGYCHTGMYLTIVTFSGSTIFSGYVFTGSTVHIIPLFGDKMRVSVEAKKS